MNQQLIRDEGHRDRLSIAELAVRMTGWLEGEYKAAIFEQSSSPVAYTLYRQDSSWIYLRHFYVQRQFRRQGIGSTAIQLLVTEGWRIRLDVLINNQVGHAFWNSVGFQDYAVLICLS